jgi:hypothetical protein
MYTFSINFELFVRQLLALLQHFGIFDHQDASSEGQKYESLGAKTPPAQQRATLLQQFEWECFKHALYSSDLVALCVCRKG